MDSLHASDLSRLPGRLGSVSFLIKLNLIAFTIYCIVLDPPDFIQFDLRKDIDAIIFPSIWQKAKIEQSAYPYNL